MFSKLTIISIKSAEFAFAIILRHSNEPCAVHKIYVEYKKFPSIISFRVENDIIDIFFHICNYRKQAVFVSVQSFRQLRERERERIIFYLRFGFNWGALTF